MLGAIETAIRKAQDSKSKPKLISIKTIIGYGMHEAGTTESSLGRTGRGSSKGNRNDISTGPITKRFFIPKGGGGRIFREAIKNGSAS
jgi:transketolase